MKKKIFTIIVTLAMVLSMIVFPTPTHTSAAISFDTLKNEAVKHLGKPYVLGGNGPNSFDCSGFTKYVFSKTTGVNLPRTAAQQYNSATKISSAQRKPGDLVFFNYGSGIAHVGIYVGGNQMIDAQNNGVKYDSLTSSYWSKYLVGYGRYYNFSPSNPNRVDGKVTNVAPLLPSPLFKNQVPIRKWKTGTKIQVYKHNNYWYKTYVENNGKWTLGYIYHGFLKDVKPIAGTTKYTATIQAFAILWDNQAMSGGKLKTYYPDHQLSYYKRSDGMYSLYYPNEKKWYYTTTYWLQPR